MLSAQGAVQQYSYQATTPLLLNTGGQPTYFMALKDASQLVKMYAMVNVSQYDAVAIGSNVEECVENYVELLADRGIGMETPQKPSGGDGEAVSGTVSDLRYAVLDGNTVCYVALEEVDGVYFTISAADAPVAVILNVGDSVTITAGSDSLEALTPASSLELTARAEPEPGSSPQRGEPAEGAGETGLEAE